MSAKQKIERGRGPSNSLGSQRFRVLPAPPLLIAPFIAL